MGADTSPSADVTRSRKLFSTVDRFAGVVYDPQKTGTSKNAALCCVFTAMVLVILGVLAVIAAMVGAGYAINKAFAPKKEDAYLKAP